MQQLHTSLPRSPAMQIRPFRPTDRDAIVALIDGVYREYGDVIYLEKADADLLDVESRYVATGGAFVVLDDDGMIRGTHAVLPLDDGNGLCTFRRLYLDTSLRGGEWGNRLMQWAVDWAAARGLRRVEFWSDTRFTRAHRFFERNGFINTGKVRDMDDGAEPYREYFFYQDLAGR